MKTRIVLAGLAAVSLTAVGATTASARTATDTRDKTLTAPCVDQLGQEQGTFTWTGPTASWPPNHKEKSAVVTLTDTDDEAATDGVTLEVVGIHDEATYEDSVATGEDNGTGNTDPVTDARGGASAGEVATDVPVFWRSERSGRGDGRTYTFTATGTVDGLAGAVSTATCEPVTFTVAVPHDQGKPKSAKRKRARR